jgi:adenylate kinase family enzyme
MHRACTFAIVPSGVNEETLSDRIRIEFLGADTTKNKVLGVYPRNLAQLDYLSDFIEEKGQIKIQYELRKGYLSSAITMFPAS